MEIPYLKGKTYNFFRRGGAQNRPRKNKHRPKLPKGPTKELKQETSLLPDPRAREASHRGSFP